VDEPAAPAWAGAFGVHQSNVCRGIEAEDMPMKASLRALLVLPVLALASALGSPIMSAQTLDRDPAARLQAAAVRFDAALAAARVTGALQPQSAEFSRLTLEFGGLSDELMAAGNAADAAFALLRSADCLRIMRRWDEARPVYQRVIPLAQKGRRSDYEAKAWLGIGRLENFGAQDHRAAREAIDRALEAVGSSPDTAILRGDILLERTDLQASAGDLDGALASASDAVTIARGSADRDLLYNTLFTRAGVHNRLTEELFKLYTGLPCLTATQWEQCEELAREMEDHAADARADFEQAHVIALELGQVTFASSIQDQLSSMQLIARARANTMAMSAQMHDLAQKQASASVIGGFLGTDGTLLEMPLLGPALPTTTPEQTQAVLAFMRRELSQMPDLPATRWRRRITQAQILEGEGDLPAAIASYRDAATLIEQERQTLPSEATRAGFTKDKVHVFDRLVIALLSRGDYAEAFRWNEQARARTMSEMLTSAGALPGRLADTVPSSLDELRRLARADRFDLAYFILDGARLIIWHIGPERMSVQSFYAPTTALRNIAVRIQQNVETRSVPFDRDAARDLYIALITPLRDRLDTTPAAGARERAAGGTGRSPG
jgi:tetratricopeptide (TPR) repeat protein